ncbi:unnamed protein product [Protopolystoma xenopodis]|uniref:Atg6 BARA domain-containing protein n=1 Tax=Protopolystoma xenopodis TaxID=117903 RepID=A0A3S5CJ02_9PLAT|nr:unnamed protein product [Protopolystoma xenopodis]
MTPESLALMRWWAFANSLSAETAEQKVTLAERESARSEIHRLHQELLTVHESGDRGAASTQALLRRAEIDRDRSLVELARVSSERDSLINKYKVRCGDPLAVIYTYRKWQGSVDGHSDFCTNIATQFSHFLAYPQADRG